MPHIESTQFGEVVIDKKKYHQVLIVGDKVEERDYEKLKESFGTAHEIGEWEINELLSNEPKIIVIGAGQNGAMDVGEKTIKKFQDKGIETIIDTTPKIIEIYNEKIKQGERVNALIHTTC